MGIDPMDWLPALIPEHVDEEQASESLAQLARAASESGWTANDGLTEENRRALSASHRPGEIASIVAVGMGHRFG